MSHVCSLLYAGVQDAAWDSLDEMQLEVYKILTEKDANYEEENPIHAPLYKLKAGGLTWNLKSLIGLGMVNVPYEIWKCTWL